MLILFEGTHNSNRPQEVNKKCFEFIEDALEARKSMSPVRNKHLGKMNEMKEMGELSPVKDETIETLVHKPQAQRDELDTDSRCSERKEVQFHTEFHSGKHHKPKLSVEKEYCETGVKIEVSQFRDVMASEDL